jgi:hypothetical protein
LPSRYFGFEITILRHCLETILELPLPACEAQEHWAAFSSAQDCIAARVVAQIEPAGDRFSRLKLIGTFAATDVAVDVFMDYLAQAWQSRPPRSHSSQALPVAPI